MISQRKRGGASPPFFSSHSGPVLVCGNAWCLQDDIKTAREIYGDIPAIAVNGAAKNVRALALFSFHPHRFVATGFGWIGRQQQIHSDFTVHSAHYDESMPWVDHWWPGTAGGGGSAWGARKLASHMGFDQVILCGAPLSPGGYSGDPIAKLMRQPAVIEGYRDGIRAETEWHEGVKSMSGWTKEFLGSPG